MTDQTAEFENSQELEKLRSQQEKISGLQDLATGKVVTAQDSDEAKRALAEWKFYDLASEHVESLLLPAEHPHQEEFADYAVESQEAFAEITQHGDWEQAKRAFQSLEGAVRSDDFKLRLSDARSMGLDPNLKYKGVLNLFSEGRPNDFQMESWEKLIGEKLALIPDKTEPYVHPDLEGLKANIG